VEFDLFFFWRRLLGLSVAIYCLITTADRLRGYWRLLHGEERHWGYARRYLVIQLLRMKPREVAWELAQILFLLSVVAALIWGHRFVPGGG